MSTFAQTRARPSIPQSLRKRFAALRRRWTPIRRYVIRHNHEWAIIHIDERYGSFSCQSTFGTYAYIWRSIGDRTLKEFLCGLDFNYFMGKTQPGYHKFDFYRSVEGIKETILRNRREGSIDKDVAREAFDEVEWLESDDGFSFTSSLCRSSGLMKVFGGDYYDLCRESPDGNSRGFWETIWPKFVEQIGGRKR
jgi:hypothetical protein